jgi:hypothetical protein
VTWQFLGDAALVVVLFNLVLMVIFWARMMQIERKQLRDDDHGRPVSRRPD